jgi:hypothetical protein
MVLSPWSWRKDFVPNLRCRALRAPSKSHLETQLTSALVDEVQDESYSDFIEAVMIWNLDENGLEA